MQMTDPFLAESYLEFNAQDLEFGFNESRRDRILRTFVRNAYYYHLNEIYSTLKNEYTDWDKPVQNPLSVRDATLEVSSRTFNKSVYLTKE
jgi:neuroligin